MQDIAKQDKSFLLRAENITLRYGQKLILDHISFDIQVGQITTLIGPNGAGKTSLIKIILGLLPATSGDLKINPTIRIGYMPQKFNFNPIIPLKVSRFLSLYQNIKSDDIVGILKEVKADHLFHSSLATLSMGELQRVLLANALLQNPDLLILDEPLQGVDIIGQIEFYDIVQNLRHKRRCSILMVSHDLHFVMASTDHVLCLNHHLCCQGHPDHIGSHPAYQSLFGDALSKSIGIYQHHHDHVHHDTFYESDKNK
ncbi:MAG: ATP-binding cassette domain-containing protein [Alphaproteobacteria bacterium]|nr:ATP-binding cassette domain-containing protein [Alphaproteobacteria bacterium]